LNSRQDELFVKQILSIPILSSIYSYRHNHSTAIKEAKCAALCNMRLSADSDGLTTDLVAGSFNSLLLSYAATSE